MSPFLAAALSLLLANDPRGVSPAADTVPFAETVEAVLSKEAPFADLDREDFEALLLQTGYEETHFDMTRVGDHGHSHCILQNWVPAALVATYESCIHVAIATLRESARLAKVTGHPDAVLAQYMGSCWSETVREMARQRMKKAVALAKKAHEVVAAAPEPPLVLAEIEIAVGGAHTPPVGPAANSCRASSLHDLIRGPLAGWASSLEASCALAWTGSPSPRYTRSHGTALGRP